MLPLSKASCWMWLQQTLPWIWPPGTCWWNCLFLPVCQWRPQNALSLLLCSSLPRREALKDPHQRAFRQRWPLPRSLGEAGRVWLQKIMADQEHFQGGQLQIGISFASSAQVWLSRILPDISRSLNTALLRSLNSQHSLTTSFGSDVINLFNILPNRDTIAKQRRFISLFLSPGHNLLSVFMTKLDRYDL